MKPELAENGRLALDMFTKEFNKPCGCQYRAYRLILMDI